MSFINHIKKSSRLGIFPSPLEGEGWDEGRMTVSYAPSYLPLPQGEGLFCVFSKCIDPYKFQAGIQFKIAGCGPLRLSGLPRTGIPR